MAPLGAPVGLYNIFVQYVMHCCLDDGLSVCLRCTLSPFLQPQLSLSLSVSLSVYLSALWHGLPPPLLLTLSDSYGF